MHVRSRFARRELGEGGEKRYASLSFETTNWKDGGEGHWLRGRARVTRYRLWIFRNSCVSSLYVTHTYIYIYMYIRRQLTPTEKKTQDGERRLKAGGEKEDDIIDKGRVLPIASCLSLQRLREGESISDNPLRLDRRINCLLLLVLCIRSWTDDRFQEWGRGKVRYQSVSQSGESATASFHSSSFSLSIPQNPFSPLRSSKGENEEERIRSARIRSA